MLSGKPCCFRHSVTCVYWGLSAEKEEIVAAAAAEAVRQIQVYVKEQAFSYPLWVLGAVPCHYERLKGKYRYRVILKCKNTSPYRTLIRAVLEAVTAQKAFAKLYLYADMNVILAYNR